MTVAACAALVERGDPDRFLAVMAAAPEARVRLFPLCAFNLEVARAPWVSAEPMIGEMRLQWWRDTVAAFAGDGPVRAHEVAAPLAQVVRDQGLPLAVLDRLIAARRWDLYRDPFADAAAMESYLDDTGGGLMWLACAALGAPPGFEAAARAVGRAAGLAGFLRAVPQLQARGRVPLVDARPGALAALAEHGLAWLEAARQDRVPPPVRAALRLGWQTRGVLRQVRDAPERVAAGQLGSSVFQSKSRLLWLTLQNAW